MPITLLTTFWKKILIAPVRPRVRRTGGGNPVEPDLGRAAVQLHGPAQRQEELAVEADRQHVLAGSELLGDLDAQRVLGSDERSEFGSTSVSSSTLRPGSPLRVAASTNGGVTAGFSPRMAGRVKSPRSREARGAVVSRALALSPGWPLTLTPPGKGSAA